MEWILQVVDEIDDAIAALRLCCLGMTAEIGLTLAGGAAIIAIGAALAAGAEVTLISSALIVLSLAAVLKFYKAAPAARRQL
jgi:hypothetical protein